MPPSKKGPNAKAAAGNALKAANEEKKKAAERAKAEAAEAAEWEKGANTRKQSRETEAAAKADEAARKRREKEELLAAEEAALGPGGKAKSVPKVTKKKGGKKKDDLSLLEDALVSAADKKLKKQKAAEKEKKEKQAAALAAAAAKPKEVEMDPLMANTESMFVDELVGRDANKARMQAEGASGIDEALSMLHVGGDGVALKSTKGLYNKFEEAMMPVVKEENPGLRMTQYKEKIWNMWKRSPENPANQKTDEA
eukprot:scaffold34646_cov173-Amphora_coffeaeformis.AAC.35